MDDDGEPCARCDGGPVDPAAWADAAMPAALREALVRCARCLAHDGVTIDRGHVPAVLRAFGPDAEPLEPWLAARAIAARPELAGAALLVAPTDAVLVQAEENHRKRLDALLRLDAPAVILDQARLDLADAAARPVRLEWERVAAWPAPHLTGAIAVGELARTLAALAIPALVAEPAPVLAAIDAAASALVLDAGGLAYRHALAATAGHELAVRFLDELGHTGLRDNQDTLLDDCYFTLLHHGHADLARTVYATWLDVAVPRAWRRVRGELTA